MDCKIIDNKIIDCKIVKKEPFLTPCKTRSTNFESFWLETFALHNIGDFDIMLENWIKFIKKKSRKYLFSFFKNSLSRKKYVIKGKKPNHVKF
jgi:hypothetical protein